MLTRWFVRASQQEYELSYAYQPRGSNLKGGAGAATGARGKLRTFVDKVAQQN